jgi:hypothetical protein
VSCDTVQEQLDELALAGALDAAGEAAEARAHARGCPACGAHLGFLRALAGELADPAAAPVPVRPAVVAAAQERARRALRAGEVRSPALGRELAVALALAVLALPLVVGQAYVVVEGGAWLLASWLPEPLLVWLGVAYLGSLGLAVGALYASIPLVVAWRRRAVMEKG